jgi:hypothetical protein
MWSADLPDVRSVYLMPMARGLDQYLANRLTNERVFQVVADPKLADAVFSDRIGEAFQWQLETLLPPEPKPVEKEAKEEEPRGRELPTETVNRLSNPSLNSSFGRGKGTIFLVDLKSRQVVWSVFEPARGTAAADLDRTASAIVSRLKKDLAPPKK